VSPVTFYFVAFEDGPKTLGRDAWLLPEQAQVGLDAVGSMPAQLVVLQWYYYPYTHSICAGILLQR
jgi:hypothetical protein